MSLFSELKRNAKSALNEHWGPAIIISLVPLFVTFLFSSFQMMSLRMVEDAFHLNQFVLDLSSFSAFNQSLIPYRGGLIALAVVSLVFAIMTILVAFPLQLGSTYWHYKLVKGEPQPLQEFFHFFENFRLYRRSTGFQISLYVRQFLWGAVFLILPTGLLSGISYLYISRVFDNSITPRMASFWIMGICILSLLYLLVFVLLMAYMNKYFLASYLYADDEILSVRESIKTSVNYTKGYRFNIIWFGLSFIGWIILMIFLPTIIYSYPYIQTSFAMYAHYLIETKKREQPTLGEKPGPENKPVNPTLVTPPSGDPMTTSGFSPSFQQDPVPFIPSQKEAPQVSGEANLQEDSNYPGL